MKIYVVGIGAGSADGMTFEARNVLEKADVIVGYTVYAELVKKLFPEKEYFVSAMKQEAERCRKRLKWRLTAEMLQLFAAVMQEFTVWRHLCMKLRQAMKMLK